MDGLKENFKKFLPYLEDLRRKLYFSTIFFLAVFIIGFFSSAFIIKSVVDIFRMSGVVIATTSPFQFADVAMDIGFFSAIISTLPIVVFQIFSFASPALTNREKKWFFLAVPISIIFFLSGFSYGFLILYYSFGLLAKINSGLGVQNIWDVSSFLSQIFITSSLLGVVFQFPIILTALIKIGIISRDFLSQKRRFAYFLVFVLVSLLPPTDGLSLLAMGLPLVFLYEFTILINIKKQQHVWIRN
ncbi:MAG: twin-arginine translocase subunit TatC [Candidatus Paceibacterota bacterium]